MMLLTSPPQSNMAGEEAGGADGPHAEDMAVRGDVEAAAMAEKIPTVEGKMSTRLTRRSCSS
jgi:hypothetical protein